MSSESAAQTLLRLGSAIKQEIEEGDPLREGGFARTAYERLIVDEGYLACRFERSVRLACGSAVYAIYLAHRTQMTLTGDRRLLCLRALEALGLLEAARQAPERLNIDTDYQKLLELMPSSKTLRPRPIASKVAARQAKARYIEVR